MVGTASFATVLSTQRHHQRWALRGWDTVLVLLPLAAAWQALSWWTGSVALASPFATAARLAGLVTTAAFWGHAAETLASASVALLISGVAGLALGIALGAHHFSDEVAEPLLIGLYTLPKVTLYPLVLTLFGLGMPAKVAFGTIHGFVPMVLKVRVAVKSRSSRNFLIIARTDARTSLGLGEALRRAELYAQAGADILFIESPETEAELERIGTAFRGSRWLVVNMIEGGRTPILGAHDLAQLGFAIAIYPAAGFLAAAAALEWVYKDLLQHASTTPAADRLLSFDATHMLMGFDVVWQRDRELSTSANRWSRGSQDAGRVGDWLSFILMMSVRT